MRATYVMSDHVASTWMSFGTACDIALSNAAEATHALRLLREGIRAVQLGAP